MDRWKGKHFQLIYYISSVCVVILAVVHMPISIPNILLTWYIKCRLVLITNINIHWAFYCTVIYFVIIFFAIVCKKSLKIPKGQSESVYQRRTDNTMTKKKAEKDKQRSTKHTHKTKDRVIRTPFVLCDSSEVFQSGRESFKQVVPVSYYFEIQVSRGDIVTINRFDPVIVVYLSQARTWFFNPTLRILCVSNDLGWQVLAHFVDIGWIVDYKYSNFLFVTL
jgi:hypothetical protein